MKWEYKVFNSADVDTATLQNDLDIQGKEGWELVGFAVKEANYLSYTYIFKRPLK